MSDSYDRNEAYIETLRKGLAFVRGLRDGLTDDTGARADNIARLKGELASADAVVIGAGAGLSTSAGFTYSGERFERWFFDFKERFGITDMYSGGFFPFPDEETRWAWWARSVYVNRYLDAPKPVYDELLALVKDKDYFVITTNVDHLFQRAGFDKARLFYTQGDYGLFQRADGRGGETYDNGEWVKKAMAAQRFIADENGAFRVPKDRLLSMRLPGELIPRAPDGAAVKMNLRADETFVEDAGWHAAAGRYADFLRERGGGRVLFLELGVGGNTPMIIKYPFWAMTAENPDAVYACVNFGEALCPERIKAQSICVDGDIAEVLRELA